MHILDRQHHRLATGDACQQFRYRRMNAMAFRVRIPRDWLRELTNSLRQIGKKPRELTAPGSQIDSKDIGPAGAYELLQCGDERSVRSADDCVAGAIEN